MIHFPRIYPPISHRMKQYSVIALSGALLSLSACTQKDVQPAPAPTPAPVPVAEAPAPAPAPVAEMPAPVAEAPVTAGSGVAPLGETPAVPDASGAVVPPPVGSGAAVVPAPVVALDATGTTTAGRMKRIEISKNYTHPAGNGSLAGVMDIEDGVVRTFALNVKNPFAEKIQTAEGANLIGKNIKDIKIDTVSGATYTTQAFNEFIDELRKTEAVAN